MAADILITVLVYSTPPPPFRANCSALALACRWVQIGDVWYGIHDDRQKTGLVHEHNSTRRGRKFRQWRNPLDVYHDLELFQRFKFPRCELLEVIDEYNDDLQYVASTKGSLSAFVGGRSCTCVCFNSLCYIRLRGRLLFHFVVYWCGNCKAFWAFFGFFFLSFLLFLVCLFFLSEKYDALKYYYHYITLLFLVQIIIVLRFAF